MNTIQPFTPTTSVKGVTLRLPGEGEVKDKGPQDGLAGTVFAAPAKMPSVLSQKKAAATAETEGPKAPSRGRRTRKASFLNSTSLKPVGEFGPLGNLLKVLPGEIEAQRPLVRTWSLQHKRVKNDLAAAEKLIADSKAVGDASAILRNVETQWNQDGLQLTPEQRTMTMEAYRSRGLFADVARFYESSVQENPSFKLYDIPREHYLVALNKTKQTMRSIEEGQAFLKERAGLPVNAEVAGGLGRAFRDISNQANKAVAGCIDKSDITQFLDMFNSLPSWPALQKTEALTRAAALERLTSLAGQSTPEAAGQLAKYLSELTGQAAEGWSQSLSPEALQTKLKDASDPLQVATEVTGLEVGDWAQLQQNLKKGAKDAVRPILDSYLRTENLDEAVQSLSALTGGKLTGAVAKAGVGAKLGELQKEVLQVKLDPGFHQLTGSPNVVGVARKGMEMSRDYYERGFATDFEYYPGINAVYNNVFLNDTKRAEQLAPLVHQACLREGGKTTTDYWNVTTQMELGVLMDDPKIVQETFGRVLTCGKAGWELDSTLQNLQKLAGLRRDSAKDTQVLDFVVSKFEERIAIGFPPADPDWKPADWIGDATKTLSRLTGIDNQAPTGNPELEAFTREIFAKSTNFQDAFTSKFQGGNYSFGGPIADMPMTRTTVQGFREVLRELKLDQTADFETFNKVADNYVEQRYGLVNAEGKRVLEDLHSPEHKEMDAYSNNRHKFACSDTSGTSKTDLVIEAAMGTGDCRHTAFTKQALFDIWKRDHITGHMQSALDATLTGDDHGYQQEIAAAKDWNELQLVTFSLQFNSKIELQRDEKGEGIQYKLVTDEQGRPRKAADDKVMRTEAHTFNALVRLDDDGNVRDLTAKDVFYKQFYPLGDCPMDFRQLSSPEGVPLGKVGIPTPEGEHLEFRGVPCGYSGNKPKAIPGECGEVTFGGVPVAFPDPAALLQDRSVLRPLVKAISQ